MKTPKENLKELFKILDEVYAYIRTVGKLSFDMECCAPRDGMERAGEDMAIVAARVHKLTHSKKYERLVSALHENSEGLTAAQKKTVEHLYEDYRKYKNLSEKFNYEYDLASNKAYAVWLEAKEKKDFNIFKDSFSEVLKFTREAIDLRDSDMKKATYYDTCLNDNEKGESIETLDVFFGALKERIVPLMNRIVKEGKPIREDFLKRTCSVDKQEALSRKLLEMEGLKTSALVFMTTEHPFTTNFGPKDVRVTTHFYENDFISNIFSTLHEGGPALFMQNEPEEFYENFTSDSMTNAMHECISRFYENIVGRSEEFIHAIYPLVLSTSGDTFSDVSEKELYEAVNIARPSLIRTEADELTYSLHILVRYELEKAFVNGDISVDEIPAMFNAKMKEYFGLDVLSDDTGCLQDVHWTGSYGYFPSYALGNAYGAQILNTMKKDFDIFADIKNSNLLTTLEWLKKNVFSKASIMTPDEWIRSITGEPLNVNYYLDYLEEKYKKLYDLK